MCAADRDGMLVSLIQSNFSGAGSGLRVGEWGINLHNRGSAFVLDDAHPNGIGPAKMPLHTLIPALSMRDGQPVARVRQRRRPRPGADAHAADRCACSSTATIRSGRSARRVSRSIPAYGRIAMEDHFDAAWIDDLRGRGHDIDVVRGYRHGPGIAHAIEVMPPGYRGRAPSGPSLRRAAARSGLVARYA